MKYIINPKYVKIHTDGNKQKMELTPGHVKEPYSEELYDFYMLAYGDVFILTDNKQ